MTCSVLFIFHEELYLLNLTVIFLKTFKLTNLNKLENTYNFFVYRWFCYFLFRVYKFLFGTVYKCIGWFEVVEKNL